MYIYISFLGLHKDPLVNETQMGQQKCNPIGDRSSNLGSMDLISRLAFENCKLVRKKESNPCV